MLVWYMGECMVSTMNINNGIIEPTHIHWKLGYESNVDIWWCRVRDSSYALVIIWDNIWVVYHIDTRMILPGLEVSSMAYRHEWYGKTFEEIIKYPYRTSCITKYEILIIDAHMV